MSLPQAISSVLVFAALLVRATPAAAQMSSVEWSARVAAQYQIYPGITYVTASNFEAKLDVYKRKDVTGPWPTMISIHGGGWTGGTKEGLMMLIQPWFEMGWNVVNIDYRVARVSHSPAAVEDCLCALRWVASHAQMYNFDVNKIVINGDSAGGHLTLTTGMIPEGEGLDRQCPGAPLPKPAALVSWYGISDVNDLLDGPNKKTYAVSWLGETPDRDAIARRVSPINYVRAGLPPILTIRGDADPVVPPAQAIAFHEALTKAGVPNQLVNVPNGKHGNFTPDDYIRVYGIMRDFLKKYDLLPLK